jgi:hypothetical protein
MVGHLRRKGADTRARDEQGCMPLHFAAKNAAVKAIKELPVKTELSTAKAISGGPPDIALLSTREQI